MVIRPAICLLALILVLLPAASSAARRACHARAEPAAGDAAVEMPCHVAPRTAAMQVSAPDCCASHPACGICGAPCAAPMRPATVARRIGSLSRAADGSLATLARVGPPLDHVPLA